MFSKNKIIEEKINNYLFDYVDGIWNCGIECIWFLEIATFLIVLECKREKLI
jgi:hypothetical protein